MAFVHAPESPETALRERMEQALARMIHRGPDEQGVTARNGWALGHCRLSIIDIATSQQPMASPDGRYRIVYNGEIYNFAELRQALSGRWDFRTAGDTEVVLAGIALDGSRFLESMEGMWAFAVWDTLDERLFLSRDRLGKKPLYYTVSGHRFACASELAVLAAVDGNPWSEDPRSTADYLRYGFYLPGTTAYTGVREVLPGHWLTWSPGGRPTTRRYWSLPSTGFDGSRAQAKEMVRTCFQRAIDRRLVADVEVGAFLSGGVDSSLIVAMQKLRSGNPPKTFTVGFRESSYDERHFARLIANEYRTDHHEQVLDDWDVARLRRLVADHVGQPFADPSVLPTSIVSELAGRHVKVVLSGDGGDELFSGYQRYQARSILRWYTRLPRGLRRSGERLLRRLPEPVSHHSRSLLKKMHLFLDVTQEADVEYVAPRAFSEGRLRQLAPDLAPLGHPAPGVPPICEGDDIQRMMASDALVYLPQDILVKVDRASMAYSLEARAPFLDRQLVELAFRLPREWHRQGLSGKRLLRSSLGDLLPAGIWKRRKQGFAVPVGQWFRQGLSRELSQLVENVPTPLVTSEVRRMIVEHANQQRDYGLRLWQLYVYFLWRQSTPSAV